MLSQLKQERMREELLQLKLKCGESVRQRLGTMVGGQSSLMLKSAMTSTVQVSKQAGRQASMKQVRRYFG